VLPRPGVAPRTRRPVARESSVDKALACWPTASPGTTGNGTHPRFAASHGLSCCAVLQRRARRPGIVPAGGRAAAGPAPCRGVDFLRLQAHRFSQPDFSALVPLEIDGDIDGFLQPCRQSAGMRHQ